MWYVLYGFFVRGRNQMLGGNKILRFRGDTVYRMFMQEQRKLS